MIEEGGIYQGKDGGSQLILKVCGILVDRFVFATGSEERANKAKAKI